MNVQMDRQMSRWIDGWMDRFSEMQQIDGRMEQGRTYRRDGQTYEQMDGWMNIQMDRLTNRETDE